MIIVKRDRKLLVALLFVLLFGMATLTACNPSEAKPTINIPADEQSFSYNQYRDLYKSMVTTLKLPKYKKIQDDLNDVPLIFVDKDTTFDKRSVLTLTGEQKDQSTQHRIIYSDDKIHRIVYVDLIYLPHSIGNDLAFYDIRSKNTKDIPIISYVNSGILSYHNFLVRITIYSTDNTPVSVYTIADTDKAIVNFLKSYKDSAK